MLLLAAALTVPGTAAADTAAPWTTQFGRLLEFPGEAPATPPPAPALTVGRDRALDCLALAIGYEAGNEPLLGQAAVAEVVLNRVAHPAFPKSVCEVVFQGSTRRTGCQFTFTCDGSLKRPRSARQRAAALQVAATALDGTRRGGVGSATHYHANYVRPYWAPALVRVAAIGAHIFYRFPGGTGAPPSARPVPAPPPVFAPWGLSLTPAVSGRL